jgi:hypothetical protein
MMSDASDPSDGAAVRIPPPLAPLIALGLGLLLHHFVQPLPIPLEGPARYGLGLVLLVAGIALIAAAWGRFRSTGQNPEPWASSPGGCPPEPSQIRARRFPPLGSSVEESYGALAQI